MIKRLLIVFVVFCVLAGAAYTLIPNSAYHLKRFIKSNDVLYSASKTLVQLKYDFFAKIKGKKEPREQTVTEVALRKDWSLVFDASQRLGKIRRFWGNVGFESFKSSVLSGGGRQLLQLMKESNQRVGAGSFSEQAFRFIRGHNLYSNGRPPWGEGCDIYRVDASGRVSYSWQTADKVFDAIVQNGFKPIIEFGFMPDALASIPDRQQKWGRANISPPKDYRKWSSLVYETVKHLRERYGKDEVAGWYFEVWNEPDLGYLFWIEDPAHKPFGDMEEYYKLYDFSVTAAKAAHPGIRVGGPASAGGEIDGMLEHVLLGKKFTNGSVPVTLDFVSTHAYGRLHDDWNNRKSKGVLRSIKWKIDRPFAHDHDKVRNRMRQTPFLLTETAPKGDSHPLHNTRFAAAWLIKLVDGVYALSDKEGRSYQPDEIVYWCSESAIRQFKTDKGLAVRLKHQGRSAVYKRPIFNAFEALGYFKGERLALKTGSKFSNPVNGMASIDENRVTILVYYLDEQNRANAATDSVDVELTVKHLPFKKYQVSWYTIDETHSNAYSVWRAMGKPKKLSDRQHRQLSGRDDLELQTKPWTENRKGADFYKKIRMQNNSISLLLLTKTD
ncbi:MAG: hypothetical protein ACE5IR_01875 [bacterium]